MPTEYNVRILSAANDKLSVHIKFIARVDASAARRFYRKIVADIESLCTSPERHAVYATPDDMQSEYRSMPSARWYRIVYQISGNTVYVGDIQDCRQDSDKHLL